MRHRKLGLKLGRPAGHRRATIASIVCGLIDRKRVRTTLPKAKRARSLAEKLVTAGRKGDLPARRLIASRLSSSAHADKLLKEIVPAMQGRPGGYTRMLKLGLRRGDNAEMALLEWVGVAVPERKKRKKPKEKAA